MLVNGSWEYLLNLRSWSWPQGKMLTCFYFRLMPKVMVHVDLEGITTADVDDDGSTWLASWQR